MRHAPTVRQTGAGELAPAREPINAAKIGRPRTAGARTSARTPSPARSAAASSAQTRAQSCCVRLPLCRMPAWSRIRQQRRSCEMHLSATCAPAPGLLQSPRLRPHCRHRSCGKLGRRCVRGGPNRVRRRARKCGKGRTPPGGSARITSASHQSSANALARLYTRRCVRLWRAAVPSWQRRRGQRRCSARHVGSNRSNDPSAVRLLLARMVQGRPLQRDALTKS